MTQIVFNPPDTSEDTIEASKSLRPEYVVQVTGVVAARPEGMANAKLATGAIELRATGFELLNKSLTPPVSPSAQEAPGEDLRLKYRYLDLRRPEMQQIMMQRASIIKGMRDYFAEQNFFAYPTPDTYQGVIINANMAAYAPAGIAAFLLEKTAAKTRYVVDPLTHAFQHDPGCS